MVNCVIYGCSSDSSKPGREKVSFYKLPAIVTHQGPQMLEITTERRRAWLAAISRDDLRCLDNVYAEEGGHGSRELYILLENFISRQFHQNYSPFDSLCISISNGVANPSEPHRFSV